MDKRGMKAMKKTTWIIAIVVALLIIAASVIFYRTVNKPEQPVNSAEFAGNLVMPNGITITDKVNKPLVPGSNLREGEVAIDDMVAVKTIFMEVEKSPLVSVTKRDKEDVTDYERAFSIAMIYPKDAPESNRLTTIEVLSDGTFITSKIVNGRDQYVKGKFGKYTMDYLVGLYTLK